MHVHMDQYPKLVKEGVFILDNEVWSTQKRIARIYGRSIPTINDHLKKIYREKELTKSLSERELIDRKSTRLNSSHIQKSRMPSSA